MEEPSFTHDIETEEDIRRLVDTFYGYARADSLIGPVFNEIIGDRWDHHLPVMYNFWSSILLGGNRYFGNPLAKHLKLPITKVHFDRWLELFFQTVDELFSGAIAEEAKKRAQSIANIMYTKISYSQGN